MNLKAAANSTDDFNKTVVIPKQSTPLIRDLNGFLMKEKRGCNSKTKGGKKDM